MKFRALLMHIFQLFTNVSFDRLFEIVNTWRKMKKEPIFLFCASCESKFSEHMKIENFLANKKGRSQLKIMKMSTSAIFSLHSHTHCDLKLIAKTHIKYIMYIFFSFCFWSKSVSTPLSLRSFDDVRSVRVLVRSYTNCAQWILYIWWHGLLRLLLPCNLNSRCSLYIFFFSLCSCSIFALIILM